jgi:O-antigen ligase
MGAVDPRGSIVGSLSSNPGGSIAAALFLFALRSPGSPKRATDVRALLLAAAAVLLFGSLAATIALLLAMMFVVVLESPKLFRPLLAVVLVGLVAGNLYYLFRGLAGSGGFIEVVAGLFGKQPHHLMNMSGRLPLWTVIWEVSQDRPFGMGFAAAERTFVVLVAGLADVGWAAKNAHSGFVSAWLGGGWCGFLLVVALLASVAWRATRVHPNVRTLVASALLLVVIGNFTIAGVGGQYNAVLMLLMALACAPTTATVPRRYRAYPARAQLLPATRW